MKIDEDTLTIYLDEEEFEWFMNLLNSESKENKKLRELLNRPTIFDFDEED
jgi:uncharacterized protein (DUF1778 family)